MQANIKMAESNNDQFIQKILANADNLKFANGVVDYVMLQNSPLYSLLRSSASCHETSHSIDQITQRAVRFVEYILEVTGDNTFENILKSNSMCMSTYETLIQKGAIRCLTADFNAKTFFIYCVTISRVAALFYNHGISGAPKSAVIHINNLLQGYNMAAGGWDDLRRIAHQFDDELRMNESTPQSTHSVEIQPLMSSQEVFGYGSTNSLQSGEHTLLSDNEENYLEQKQDFVCAKEKELQKTCAQYFSENRTGIGSSASKIPESLLEDLSATFSFEGNKVINTSGSNVKLSSGTSKTDQEPDLTENERKIIIDLSRNVMNCENFKRKFIDKCSSDDRVIPGPSKKSDLTEKRRCREELDMGMKDNSERLTIERDELIDNSSSANGFLMDTSSNYQTSSFTSAEGNIDFLSDEKICESYPAMTSGENKSVNESEPNEKLVSETPDSNQTSKRSVYVSSYKKNNTNAENLPLTDEEKSPKFKNS